ncbi:hypothetical protein [Kribbella speibonae]|uniref:GerMN domain-containing protein n=1 Tax=Kribbella speibonae TaxID=1572660 RepID=A0A4R0IAY5_9ACTN|nr:hypothetical protein [Kribbella speibonae]TCC30211.1 hypothetical protein E0H92_40300 [Kribbella speibonae]
MAVRGRVLIPCAGILLASAVVAGCSVAEGSSPPPTVQPTPSIVVPRSTTALKPATDCTGSTQQLPTESETGGVQLTLSTDPSRTSLLLKNTGSLSVVVIPDASFTSRLVAAPYANPQDQASRAALIAVNNSGAKMSDIPRYVPLTQVITIPPQWAVCALTDSAEETASVRYLQDRQSSAEYFVTKALADQLTVRTSLDRVRPALVRCAKSTLIVLASHPEMSDIELYVEILSPRSLCQAGYKALLGGDSGATAQLEAAVIQRLGGAPRLLANSRLFSITAQS